MPLLRLFPLLLLLFCAACSSPDAPWPSYYWAKGYCVSVFGQTDGWDIVELNGLQVSMTASEWPARTNYSDVCNRTKDALVRGTNVVTLHFGPNLLSADTQGSLFAYAPNLELSVYDIEGHDDLDDGPPERLAVVPPARLDSLYAPWLSAAQAEHRRLVASDSLLAVVARSGLRPQAFLRDTLLAGGANEWQMLQAHRTMQADLRAWVRAHPLTVETTFEAEHGPDHGWLLGRPVEIERARARHPWERRYKLVGGVRALEGTAADSARLRAFAVDLRDGLAGRDTAAVFELVRPLYQKGAHTPVQVDTLRERIAPALYSKWFRYPHHLDYEASGVGLRSWSGGRVWELYRTDSLGKAFGARALLLTGKSGFRRVFAAEVDGRLRAVR